jgi:hypothetical protein
MTISINHINYQSILINSLDRCGGYSLSPHEPHPMTLGRSKKDPIGELGSY